MQLCVAVMDGTRWVFVENIDLPKTLFDLAQYLTLVTVEEIVDMLAGYDITRGADVVIIVFLTAEALVFGIVFDIVKTVVVVVVVVETDAVDFVVDFPVLGTAAVAPGMNFSVVAAGFHQYNLSITYPTANSLLDYSLLAISHRLAVLIIRRRCSCNLHLKVVLKPTRSSNLP